MFGVVDSESLPKVADGATLGYHRDREGEGPAGHDGYHDPARNLEWLDNEESAVKTQYGYLDNTEIGGRYNVNSIPALSPSGQCLRVRRQVLKIIAARAQNPRTFSKFVSVDVCISSPWGPSCCRCPRPPISAAVPRQQSCQVSKIMWSW